MDAYSLNAWNFIGENPPILGSRNATGSDVGRTARVAMAQFQEVLGTFEASGPVSGHSQFSMDDQFQELLTWGSTFRKAPRVSMTGGDWNMVTRALEAPDEINIFSFSVASIFQPSQWFVNMSF